MNPLHEVPDKAGEVLVGQQWRVCRFDPVARRELIPATVP